MKSLKNLLVMGVVAAGLYLLVGYMVVTDEEKVADIISKGAVAVKEGDLGSIDEILSQNYDYNGMNRERFLRKAKSTLEKYSPMNLRLMNQKIDFPTEGEAVVRFMALTSPQGKSMIPGLTKSFWKIMLEKEGESWLVTGVEPVE